MRRPVGIAALALVLVAGAPALAGCALIESVVEGATGGDLDIGGTDLPADFPTADVPLAEGDIVNASVFSQDGTRTWNVLMNVADPDAPETISAQLQAAGFAATGAGTVGEQGGTIAFVKDPYGVNVLFAKVDGRWTANYTVARTGG